MSITEIQEGVNHNFVLRSITGNTYFIKKQKPISLPLKNPLKMLNWHIANSWFRSPHLSHMIILPRPYSQQELQKELLTWRLWKEAGIPVLEYHCVVPQTYTIAWKFKENCISFSTLLNQPGTFYNEFEMVLTLFEKLQKLAFQHHDSNYMHSDPTLQNFLYDPQKKRVYPIDSAVVMDTRIGIEKLNIFSINLFLGSILKLNQPDYIVRKYVRQLANHLSPKDAQNLYEFKRQYSFLGQWYYRLRNFRQQKLKKITDSNTYCEEDIIFNQRFTNCAADILKERF